MNEIITRFAIGAPGFLVAIVFHEWSHAFMAKRFGDNTAEGLGRLTLNPVAHLDIFGTIIFPLICVFFGSTPFGWAKPVPINAARFKKVRPGIFWVSFAGPMMNLFLGTFFSFILVMTYKYLSHDLSLFEPLLKILQSAVVINFILAVFNLIPIPPLDGSQMVTSFLSYEGMKRYEVVARLGPFIFLIFLLTNIGEYILRPAMWMSNGMIQMFSFLLT